MAQAAIAANLRQATNVNLYLSLEIALHTVFALNRVAQFSRFGFRQIAHARVQS